MAELQTNLNVSPYYDDYNESNQYYRILFRPSTAVQARELTQLQTILQKQVSRFGDSIYKDGTIIQGCGFVRFPNIAQAKFKDSNTSTLDFGILAVGSESLANTSTARSNNYLLVSNTTGVRAALFQAFTGAEAAVDTGSDNTNRAYIIYVASGNTGGVQVDTFSTSSEQIDVYTYAQDKLGPLNSANKVGVIYTLSSNSTVNALGEGYGLHINPGVIYQKGFFLNTTEANFIIKEHSSNAAGIKVGFNTKEYIVKPEEDPSLYDNSIGSPNYSAPGAHRLKLVPEPIYYDSTNNSITIPDSFLTVLEFDSNDGRTVEQKTQPEYSIIGDMIASRTFEESGNYVIKPFNVDVTAHASNTEQMYYNISSGAAYIDGYRVPRQGGSMIRKVVADRAITTESANSQALTFNYGNYFLVDDLSGVIDISNNPEVEIYSANQYSLSNNQSYSGAPSFGAVAIANANVRAIRYSTGTPGTPNAQYRVYIFNYRPKPGISSSLAANAKSIYVNGTYGRVYADIVANGQNQVQINDTNNNKLIYFTGYNGVKRLTNNTGVNDTTFTYRTTQTQNITRSAGKGTAAFTLAGPDKYFYGAGTLSDANELVPMMYFNSNTWSSEIATGAAIGGVSNGTHSNLVWTSTSVNISSKLRVGSGLYVLWPASAGAGGPAYCTVTAINSANSITLTPNVTSVAPFTGSSANVSLFFKRGTPVDFTGSGNTLTISSDRLTATVSLSFDPNTAATYSLATQIPVTRTSATPIQKVVKKDVYVAINCASHSASSTGPWGLGLPDVYKINNVWVGSNFANTNQDRTGWFVLDNGQRDSHYQHAQLVLKPAYKNNITSASRIFVSLNHFQANITSSQAGFFSVDSYPIDDANTANTSAIATAEIPLFISDTTNTYDLRNHIDIRPVFANTAVSNSGNTTFGQYTINPVNNFNTFVTGGIAGISIEPDSNFSYNVENYLPRIDSIIITKEENVLVKQGIPSNDPKLPSINNAGIKIADVIVPPYPSLTFQEAE